MSNHLLKHSSANTIFSLFLFEQNFKISAIIDIIDDRL